MISKSQYSLLILFLSIVIIKSISSIYYIEDIDSLRFALSVYDEFSLLHLQPHFPGYPIFCLFAKIIYFFTGNLGYAFSIIGAVSSFFIAYFSLLITGSKNDFKERLFVVSVILLNPMICLLGNRYMPDLMGLSIAVVSFYYITEENRNKVLLGSFLSAILCGVRLSYFPLLIIPIFVALKNLCKNDRLLLAICFLFGISIWLMPMVLITGLKDLVYVALNQSSGHFYDYGGTFITENNWIDRFKFFTHTVWADGLGGYWGGRSNITLAISAFILLISHSMYRFIVDDLSQNNRIKILLNSALLYFLWIMMFQNIIYKSRHVLPIVFVILILMLISQKHILKKNLLFNLSKILFVISLGVLSFNLSWQHKQYTAILQARNHILDIEDNANIVSTPLINFYLKSTGVDGRYYNVEDLKSIEDFKNHLNSKKSDEKIIMIGDFRNRLSPDVRLVLDTVFYHNPYMNRMWSTIKVYSN